MINCCTQLPPDSSHSATEDVCMEQPQDHGGEASTELLLHQQREDTGEGNGRAPMPSAHDVVTDPEMGDSAHQKDIAMMPTTYRVHRNGKEVACEECGKRLLQKNLKRHLTTVHQETLKSRKCGGGGVCVDCKQGIFMVPKSAQGNQYPLHVQYCVSTPVQKVTCTLDECVSLMRSASKGDVPSFSCQHVASVSKADLFPDQGYCQDSTLTALIEKRIVAAKYEQELHDKRDESLAAGSPDVVSWRPGGQYIFLSVFHSTSHTAHFDGLGRVVVRYDMKSYTLDCKCCARKRGCLHKRMSLWHLSEVWPGLVEQPGGGKEGEEVSDQEMDVSSTAEAEPTSNQGTASLRAVLEYELQHKRIPPDVTPQKLKSRIDAISPTETVCPLCDEHPQLITEISTTNAKLIDLTECRDGNCCCTQHCIVCGFPDK